MAAVSRPLRGIQLSALVEVPTYEISNPSRPGEPSHLKPETKPAPNTQRRHSPKGQASGSIKSRIGNTKRKRPTVSYFYEWYERGNVRQVYIPVRQVAQVREAIASRQPVNFILEMLKR